MKKDLTFIALCLSLAFVLSRIAGQLYYNPRPFVVGDFEPLIAHAPDNGFPSDHTLLFATIAVIVWYYDKRYSAALWVLAFCVGAWRIYGGVHHFVDILGSVVIAIIATSSAHAIIHQLWNKNKQANS